jgi:glycerophosphoryl diester phosphodiesterase
MDFASITKKVASEVLKQSERIKRIQKSLEHPSRVTVVAHRGGPGMGPHENTLKAFQKAIECGADMIETDVRRTSDGVLICHHDDHIQKSLLANITYAEANVLAKKQGYEIPQLKHLLALAQGRIQLDIELKEVGYELDVIDTILSSMKHSEFVIKSFNDSSVYAIKEIDPRIVAGLLVEKTPFANRALDTVAKASYEARLALTRADFLGPEVSLVNKTLVTRMHLLGKKVFVWTPNSDAEIEALVELGVDAIITDNPHRALEILGR